MRSGGVATSSEAVSAAAATATATATTNAATGDVSGAKERGVSRSDGRAVGRSVVGAMPVSSHRLIRPRRSECKKFKNLKGAV